MRERDKPKQPDQHWPFAPMQPGDHEPVDLPDEPIDVDEEMAQRLKERGKRPT